MKRYNVAILGATGAVGREMMKVLEERQFPIAQLKLLASSRSAGKTILFNGREQIIEEAREDSFDGVDIVLGAAENDIAMKYLPIAAAKGAVVVDNSSAYRLDDDVPLIIPEINPQDVHAHHGIIANPNCATIIALVAAWPLHQAFGIRRMIVSTYQAVSGAGVGGIRELNEQMKALSQKTLAELDTDLKNKKSELFNLRFQLATGQLQNTAALKQCKKDIARVKTVIRQLEMSGKA